MPDPIAAPSNAPAPALAMVNAPALHDDPGPPPSPQSDGKTTAPARAKAAPPTTSPVTVLLRRTQRESATRTDCTVSPAVIWRTVGSVVTAASRPSRRGPPEARTRTCWPGLRRAATLSKVVWARTPPGALQASSAPSNAFGVVALTVV